MTCVGFAQPAKDIDNATSPIVNSFANFIKCYRRKVVNRLQKADDCSSKGSEHLLILLYPHFSSEAAQKSKHR